MLSHQNERIFECSFVTFRIFVSALVYPSSFALGEVENMSAILEVSPQVLIIRSKHESDKSKV